MADNATAEVMGTEMETEMENTTPMVREGASVHSIQAEKCRQRIEDAIRGANVAFYDLSMGLLEAYENDYAKDWGYDNWTQYVEGKLDMKYRTAYYMVEIAKAVRQLGISKERVQKIGWTKLKEITGVITSKPNESEKYLDMAENMSTSELREALHSEVKLTEGKEATAAIMRMSLKFEGDAAGIMSDGLSLAYGDIGKEDVSLALSHIVGEWLLARGGNVQSSTLEDWVAYIKKVYGVTMVKATDEEGIDALLADRDEVMEVEATEAEDDAALEELLK